MSSNVKASWKREESGESQRTKYQKESNKKVNVVWINQNMDTPQDQLYLEELKKNEQLKVECFKEIGITINYLKNLEFEETYIITNGKFYIKFIEEFKKNIREICVIPKIIILTTDKKDFLTKNPEYKNFEKDPYYNLGGIQTSFDDIKKFIFKKNEPKKEIKEFKDNKNNQISRFLTNNQKDTDLIFDYVDDKLKLVYPLLYKSLIKINKNDNINLFTGSLYDKYKKFKDIYDLFNPIIDLSNVPIELLSKYYARLQTLQTAFYTDINKDLRENNKENYLIYIKVLYEGLKLKSFKLSEDEVLYRGGKLSNNEIEKIKKDLKDLANKKEKEPGIIVFSKTFLSFSKEESIAKEFLGDREKGLNKVIFILENTEKIDYNLSTHADIEKISFFPREKEVLFFPFSAFKIKEMNEKKVKEDSAFKTKETNEKKVKEDSAFKTKERKKEEKKKEEVIYEIKLIYLNKYFEGLEKFNTEINLDKTIPKTKYTEFLEESGLIEKMTYELKPIILNYAKYIEEIDKIQDQKEKTKDNDEKEKIKKNDKKEIMKANNKNNNYIIAEIEIKESDLNKDIRIINSYENQSKEGEQENKNKNEKEIKDNIEITINDEIIPFSYSYKFKEKGKYKIKYSFKNKLTNTNYMFYKCEYLIKIDLSKLNTENVKDMNHMFSECKSLTNIDLTNINTKNVDDMKYMFRGCSSLTNINLSSFDTQKVKYMESMFDGCQSLISLNLSNFKTENVINMKYMFYKCSSLTSLNLSNFTNQKLKDISCMFSGCSSLKNINLEKFNTDNVADMSCVFSECESLISIDLSNFDTKNVTNMKYMFYKCLSLTSLNLSNFDTQNVTNMSNMFENCTILRNLDLSNFDMSGVTFSDNMFSGCNSLKKENTKVKDTSILELISE